MIPQEGWAGEGDDPLRMVGWDRDYPVSPSTVPGGIGAHQDLPARSQVPPRDRSST